MPKLILIKNGKPNATLVISAKPRQATQLAAAEFQHYIEKISGTTLPVISDDNYPLDGNLVFIGESRFTRRLGYKNEDFFSDESIVKTGANKLAVKKGFQYLLIMGRDHDSYGNITYDEDGVYPGFEWSHNVGTLYGVLDFLEEQCDVRWYLPGEEVGEIVPVKHTIKVHKLNRHHRPWARHRFISPYLYPKSYYWWQPKHLFSFELGGGTLPQITRSHPVPVDVIEEFVKHGYPLSVDQKKQFSYDEARKVWQIPIDNKNPSYILREKTNSIMVFRDVIAREDLADKRDVNLWWLHMKMKKEYSTAPSHDSWFHKKFCYMPLYNAKVISKEYGIKNAEISDYPLTDLVNFFAQGYEDIKNLIENELKKCELPISISSEFIDHMKILQPCFSNPNVIHEYIEAAKLYFNTGTTYSISWLLKDKTIFAECVSGKWCSWDESRFHKLVLEKYGLVDGTNKDVARFLKPAFQGIRILSESARITRIDSKHWEVHDENNLGPKYYWIELKKVKKPETRTQKVKFRNSEVEEQVKVPILYVDIYQCLEDVPHFDVSPLDNEYFCKCNECKCKWKQTTTKPYAGFWNDNSSFLMWNFVNAVARGTQTSHPTKWISCQAYKGFHKPYVYNPCREIPEELNLEPNVAVMFCRELTDEWNTDCIQADDNLTKGIPVNYPHTDAKKINDAALDAWINVAKAKKIYLYRYFSHPRLFDLGVMPSWAPKKISNDLVEMKKKGIQGAYNELNVKPIFDHKSYEHPRCWPNPIIDQVNVLVWMKYLYSQHPPQYPPSWFKQFYFEFFGPAGTHIEKFVTVCAGIYWNSMLHCYYQSTYGSKNAKVIYCPPDRLPLLTNLIEDAYKAVKGQPVYQKRVELFDRGVYRMIEANSREY